MKAQRPKKLPMLISNSVPVRRHFRVRRRGVRFGSKKPDDGESPHTVLQLLQQSLIPGKQAAKAHDPVLGCLKIDGF